MQICIINNANLKENDFEYKNHLFFLNFLLLKIKVETDNIIFRKELGKIILTIVRLYIYY